MIFIHCYGLGRIKVVTHSSLGLKICQVHFLYDLFEGRKAKQLYFIFHPGFQLHESQVIVGMKQIMETELRLRVDFNKRETSKPQEVIFIGNFSEFYENKILAAWRSSEFNAKLAFCSHFWQWKILNITQAGLSCRFVFEPKEAFKSTFFKFWLQYDFLSAFST